MPDQARHITIQLTRRRRMRLEDAALRLENQAASMSNGITRADVHSEAATIRELLAATPPSHSDKPRYTLEGRQVLIDLPSGKKAAVIGYVVQTEDGLAVAQREGCEIDADELRKAAAPPSPSGLVLSVTLEVAKANGFCPVCESYGGGDAPEGHEDSDCQGSCPECWCPGCHDGRDFPANRIGELDDGDPSGSWLAFELIHGPDPAGARLYVRPLPSPAATRELLGAATPSDEPREGR